MIWAHMGQWHTSCGTQVIPRRVIGETRTYFKPYCPYCNVDPTIATLINNSDEINAAFRLGGRLAVRAMLRGR